MDNNGKIPLTGTPTAQKDRLIKTAKYFSTSSQEEETLILTDANVNQAYLQIPEDLRPNSQQQQKITQAYKEHILDKGYTILNKKKPNQTHLEKFTSLTTSSPPTPTYSQTPQPLKNTSVTIIWSHLQDLPNNK